MANIPLVHNAEDVILEHLKLYHEQTWLVNGVSTRLGRVFLDPPTTFSDIELPLMILLMGGQNNPIPQTSSNSYILDRTYTARLYLIAKNMGLEEYHVGNKLARQWVARLRTLYTRYLRLEIPAVAGYEKGLPNMAQGFSFRDTGLKNLRAPNGTEYWGVDIDLDVPVRIVSEKPLS